jgi:hypothetical protein
LGALDFEDKSNNAVYKVKEVFKVGAKYTSDPNSIPMMVLALERDIINLDQDLISIDEDGTKHYIADYYLKKDKDNNKDDNTDIDNNDNLSYYLKLSPNQSLIYEGDSVTYECYIYNNEDDIIDQNVNFETLLSGTSIPESYYKCDVENNKITITNLRRYFKSDLILTCSVDVDTYNVEPLSFSIQLGEKL